MLQKLLSLDGELARYIYLHRPKGADSFLMWVTNHATAVAFGFIVLLIISAVVQKNTKYFYAAVNIVLIIGIGALLSNSLKFLTRRPRPYEVQEQILTPIIESGGYSFPSGHTTEVFALATAVFLLFRNPFLRGLVLLWAILIAYTRIAFGVHYPLDVLGGIVLGSLTAYLWLKSQALQKLFNMKPPSKSFKRN